MPEEDRRGCQIPWGCSYRQCELLCGCWELNPGLLEEQHIGYSGNAGDGGPGAEQGTALLLKSAALLGGRWGHSL